MRGLFDELKHLSLIYMKKKRNQVERKHFSHHRTYTLTNV